MSVEELNQILRAQDAAEAEQARHRDRLRTVRDTCAVIAAMGFAVLMLWVLAVAFGLPA